MTKLTKINLNATAYDLSDHVLADLEQQVKADEKVKFNEVIIPSNNGNVTTSAYQYRLYNRLLFMNGYTATENQRLCIYGDFAYSGSAPSYANKPAWYHDPFAGFIVGHEYKFSYQIISGTVNRGTITKDFYWDLRTASGSSVFIADDQIWECTFVPEMIAFCGRAFTYTNAVICMDIVDITASIESLYDVPTYFESQLSTAIAKINTDINDYKTVGTYGTDIEAFVFITDVHWRNNTKHSPALIKRIIDKTPIDTVICGGDLVYAYNPTKTGAVGEIRDFNEAITGISGAEYYAVVGNHDLNTNSNSDISIQFTGWEIYNLLYEPFCNQKNVHFAIDDPDSGYGEPIKHDYYFDHPQTKTRFLCLDWRNPFNTPRQTWLTSVLSRNDGYRVVVIYHGIYAYDANASSGIVTEHDSIMQYLAPYKSKIVALFTGHVHVDHVVDYWGDSTTPVIITGCDSLTTGMEEGTVTEQCFDVAVIDYNEGKIKLTRIGNGSDRTVNFTLGS